MKRASTSSETKPSAKRAVTNNAPTSSQRLMAAGSEAIEAHARVRWLADRLSEELEMKEPEGVPHSIDPEDSMVIAVEKAGNTMAAVSASMAAVATSPPPPPFMPSTNLGIGPVPVRPAKTKLGIGTGSRNKPENKPDGDK